MELLTDCIAIKYGFQIKQVGGELLDGRQLHFLVIDSCRCLGKEEEERKVKKWRGGRGRKEVREEVNRGGRREQRGKEGKDQRRGKREDERDGEDEEFSDLVV